MEDAEPHMKKLEQLVIATANANKYADLADLSREIADEVIFSPNLASLTIAETGRTYAANAQLKAESWSAASKLPSLADDSGLEVFALAGKPGLYSSRIVAGSDRDKVSWLLKELSGQVDRRARFVCAIALSLPDERTLITQGYCYGQIALTPCGKQGFGYDPVFIPDGYTKTFSELSFSQKNEISHRAAAMRRLYEYFM